ncbi:MAG TPA: hypothetical protein VFE63_09570 [Roseiarcus sp.]|jgi:hypothetical protein|nr:hypothetical protein [Roseiarcus sp.]
MKFRRLACDCCKSSEFPSLCKSPTYVLSEVVEDSNIIFLLTTKRGGPSCDKPLAGARDSAGREREAVVRECDPCEPSDVTWIGRLGAEILGDCWRPTDGLAENDDFQSGESPIRRNKRLLEEGSGFWPKRIFDRETDAAARDWD